MERQILISHFRFWGFTCKSLGWSMKEKRLLGNPDKLGLFARRVWDGAAAIAARKRRGATVDDLRHALYWFACGVRSAKQLTEPWHRLRCKGWMLLCLDDHDEEGQRLANMRRMNERAQP
jgi:hypothetical protein